MRQIIVIKKQQQNQIVAATKLKFVQKEKKSKTFISNIICLT